jgi:hypothetical protein
MLTIPAKFYHLFFEVAPKDQGQMIESAWAFDSVENCWVNRITDRSELSAYYYGHATLKNDDVFCIANGNPVEQGFASKKFKQFFIVLGK